MAKPKNQFAEEAQEVAERLQRARDRGEQLVLPGDLAPAAEPAKGAGGRGPGKVKSQLREWLLARGFRAPEDVLAELAGLSQPEGLIVAAMRETEQILAWAFDGAEIPKGGVKAATARMRLDLFTTILATRMRAADALMPYVAPKISPDVVQQINATQIVMPAAPSAAVERGDQARDVTPQGRRIGPPPMPWDMQQNQEVSEGDPEGSDGKARTK